MNKMCLFLYVIESSNRYIEGFEAYIFFLRAAKTYVENSCVSIYFSKIAVIFNSLYYKPFQIMD